MTFTSLNMRFIKTKLFPEILIFGFLFVSYVSVPMLPEEIITSFKKGDSKLLFKYFNQNIELAIPGNNNNIYSRSQAQQIMGRFFDKNIPEKFTILSNETKKDSNYVIATLVTRNGSFRVYMLLKENDRNKLIQLLKIEKK